MPEHHPIASPPRLADAALAALGGMDESDFRATDFRVIGPADYACIRAALVRLKKLEESFHD